MNKSNPRIQCSFFGGFRIFDRYGIEQRFPVAKGAALIAYLALSPWGRATRGELTGLLWSERPESTARTALRQCLYQMKGVLADIESNLISSTPDSIFLDLQKLRCDTDILFAKTQSAVLDFEFDPRSLLKGFEDLDPAFEEWIVRTRDEVEQKLREMLREILDGEFSPKEDRLRAAGRLVQIDPCYESAARLLIEEAASRNDQAGMLEVYSNLWNALDEEWGEEPSTALKEFVGEVRVQLNQPVSPKILKRRKFLTVMAVRLSTAIDVSLEPEESAITRTEMLVKARDIITAYNGVMLQENEEGLRAAFGIPLASETDVRNSVEASIEVCKALSEHAEICSNIGLDSGVLLVEETVGSNAVRVVGPSLDRAIMLAHQPGDDCVYATEHTVRNLHDKYLMRKSLSNYQDRTPIIQIIERKQESESISIREGRHAFIGRAEYLEKLNEIWAAAEEVSGLQIASIQGPPGIGKTRLADEFLQQLELNNIQTARVVCNRYNRTAPFEPVQALITILAERHNSSVGTSTIELPQSAVDPVGATEMSWHLKKSISKLPTALFFDDWQWADDATRVALGRFSAAHHDTPLLIIITSREASYEDRLISISHPILLPNMTQKEVETKASLLMDQPLNHNLKEEIFSKSGGNPLFIEEICHALSDPKNSLKRKDTASSLPANMHSLIASRFERLTPEDLNIIFAAAVHGDNLEPDLLSAVVGREVPETAYQNLRELDILAPGEVGTAARFKHGLAREVAYDMIPLLQRRELHLSYAKHLSNGVTDEGDTTNVEKLALHYRGGGETKLASNFSEKSGDKALIASALDQAMWHYETSMELIDTDASQEEQLRWISIAMRCAVPCVYAASRDYLKVLEQAEEFALAAEDQLAACQTRYWAGYLQFVLGDQQDAMNSLHAAAKQARALGDVRMETEATAIIGCALASIARYQEAEDTMRSAISTKEQNPGKGRRPPVTSVYTRANLAMVRADGGDFEEADELIIEALRRVSGFEHEVESSILCHSAATHIWRGNWEIALDHAARARERSEKVSSPYLMGMSRCIWGYAYWRQHGGDEGLTMLSDAAAFMEEKGMKLFLSFIYGWLAEAMAESGEYEKAKKACEGAIAREKEGEIIGAAMAYRAAALCHLETGEFDEASKQLRLAEGIAEKRDAPHEIGANHLFAARLYVRKRQFEDGFSELENARKICSELGLTFRLEAADELEQAIKAKI